MAAEDERDRHRRVDVRSREVTGRVNHRHDHQAEDQSDPDGAERSAVDGIGDDRAAACEDEGERGEALGGGAPRQVRPLRHLPATRRGGPGRGARSRRGSLAP